MRKTIIIAICVVLIAIFVGCSTTGAESIPPTYEFTPGLSSGRQYEILGEVVFDGTRREVLGIQTQGGKGYSEFLALTKTLYPDCDALINCFIDRTNTNLILVRSTTQIYRGTAVKYK